MKITAVRHGQTNKNIKQICDDNPKNNVTLNSVGEEQAKKAALKLKSSKFDIIYASELLRTTDTARIINLEHNLDIEIDSRLNDRKSGFSGSSVADFHTALRESKDIWNAKFNDGESFLEEKKRVFSFLEELKSKSFESVLIVTHMETLQIINGYFKKLSNEEMWKTKVNNCDVFEFEI